MTTVTKGKAPQRPTAKAFESNHFISLDGNENSFDVFHSTQNTKKIQCQRCFPPMVKPSGAVKLCADCKADCIQIEATLLENLSRPRKVVKLHRCIACEKNFALSKFSIYFGICRECFSDRQSPKKARRLAAQAARNVARVFGGAR